MLIYAHIRTHNYFQEYWMGLMCIKCICPHALMCFKLFDLRKCLYVYRFVRVYMHVYVIFIKILS